MMNRCLTCRLIIGLLLVLIGVSPAHCQTRQVVLLYDERTTLPGLAALDASIARTLTSSSVEPTEVYRESMDLSRFGSDTYLLLLQDYLRKKYADKKIDVVVAVMSPALDFLLSHENVVFPGTPIVFCGIDRRELGGRVLPSRVTGVLLKRAFAPTLDIAVKLHPRTIGPTYPHMSNFVLVPNTRFSILYIVITTMMERLVDRPQVTKHCEERVYFEATSPRT